jgi:hypothetical protein
MKNLVSEKCVNCGGIIHIDITKELSELNESLLEACKQGLSAVKFARENMGSDFLGTIAVMENAIKQSEQ